MPSNQQTMPYKTQNANFKPPEGSRPMNVTPSHGNQTSLEPQVTLELSPACLEKISSAIPEENSGSVMTPQKRISKKGSNQKKSVRVEQEEKKSETDGGRNFDIQGSDTNQIQKANPGGSTNSNRHLIT